MYPIDGKDTRIQTLEAEKERALQVITHAYVNNHLVMEEFERLADKIEHSGEITEIQALYREHRSQEAALSPAPASLDLRDHERLICTGSKKKIENGILLSKKLELELAHSTLILDYSSLEMPSGDYEIVIVAKHSSCKIILPPGSEVENRANEVYSSITEPRSDGSVGSSRIRIRLTGEVIHSSVKFMRVKGKKGFLARLFGKSD